VGGAHRLDRLDLVKIDVEGAEPDVLLGMRRSLVRLRPRAVVVETKARVLQRAATDAASVAEVLDGCGYRPTGQVLHHNAVFRPAEAT